MALKSTIYKVELSIADMDRHYYETHNLTVARHPSETDERMMVRLLAFALNAHERLQFTRGLSTENEPELWQKNYSNEIEVWIDLGMPSDKRVRQASNKADKSIIYTYGGNAADMWWDKIKSSTTRFKNLQVTNIIQEDSTALEQFASRSMRLQVNIQDGDVMISNAIDTLHVTPITWKEATI
jgi:uncharacterized protein YaeQ